MPDKAFEHMEFLAYGKATKLAPISLTDADFADLIVPSTIIGIRKRSKSRFVFNLSGGSKLELYDTPEGMRIYFSSEMKTLFDIPFPLFRAGINCSVLGLTHELATLNDLYALIFLVQSNRKDEACSLLKIQPDLELARLLPVDHLLYIESVGGGSLWATIKARSKAGFRAAAALGNIVYPRAREAWLRRIEAEARAKEAKATKEEIKTNKEALELYKDAVNFYDGYIKDRPDDDPIKQRFIENLKQLGVRPSLKPVVITHVKNE